MQYLLMDSMGRARSNYHTQDIVFEEELKLMFRHLQNTESLRMVGVTVQDHLPEGREYLLFAEFIRDSPQIKIVYMTGNMLFNN